MGAGSKTVNTNKSQGEECWVSCKKCSTETRHKVLQSVDISVRESFRGELLYGADDSYQIVQCQGCDDVSFRKTHINSEDYYSDPETGEQIFDAVIDVYPSRVAGRHKLRQADFLPFQISKIYDETHAALCSKQPVLAGIGIRVLVEAICKQEQAAGKNLEQKIDSLVALEVLKKSGAEMLQGTRLLGNAAAHEVKPHSEEILSLAMDVVEHLLTDVYILPAVMNKLPTRKKSD
ncbi:hypothetical protein BH24DEI2_BH24DEI2_21910 [soil metagenome]